MVIVVSKMALSLTTGTTSADQVSGTYQFVPKGMIKFYALGSATGLTFSLLNNGMSLANAQAIPFFGTTGALATSDHYIGGGGTLGGRVELTFRATTGTPTVDYLLSYDAVPFAGAISRAFGRR